ncbi:MAG: hypothetical protein WBK20_11185, partial [Spirochaetota bacterium]
MWKKLTANTLGDSSYYKLPVKHNTKSAIYSRKAFVELAKLENCGKKLYMVYRISSLESHNTGVTDTVD